jgi:hypothetical protein
MQNTILWKGFRMRKRFLCLAIILFLFVGFVIDGSPVEASSSVEISFDSTLARVNQGEKVLFPPAEPFIGRGDVIMITGYVYPRGTWASDPNCIHPVSGWMCGAEQAGGSSFEPIGEIVCTGHFFANPFEFFPPGENPQLGKEIGVFFLNLRFGADNSNTLELRGRTLTGFDGSHPAKFSVFGGTGIFKKVRGEALEIMIRPNRSGAFNFEIDLSGVKGVKKGKLKTLIGAN